MGIEWRLSFIFECRRFVNNDDGFYWYALNDPSGLTGENIATIFAVGVNARFPTNRLNPEQLGTQRNNVTRKRVFRGVDICLKFFGSGKIQVSGKRQRQKSHVYPVAGFQVESASLYYEQRSDLTPRQRRVWRQSRRGTTGRRNFFCRVWIQISDRAG